MRDGSSALADWAERWFPDRAFVFALVAVALVFTAGCSAGRPASDMVTYFGDGFWSLVPLLTMQMSMVVVGGYVVASAPPIYSLIRRLAAIPTTPRGAVAFVALVSTTTSLISYGFSLIFAGFLAREIARRLSGVDYRALGAAAYLGLGSVWALGLSSSAALLMATKASLPPALAKVSGIIPLSQTIFTWQSALTAAALAAVSVMVAYLSAPTGNAARTAESFDVNLDPLVKEIEPRKAPGEWVGILTISDNPGVRFGIHVFGRSPGRERLDGSLRLKHLQSGVSYAGTVAALEAEIVYASRAICRTGDGGNFSPISVLCWHIWHDFHVAAFEHAGAVFCARLDP